MFVRRFVVHPIEFLIILKEDIPWLVFLKLHLPYVPLMPLRVTEEEEYEGLDVTEHEERSYDLV